MSRLTRQKALRSKCPSGKRRFKTLEQAEERLAEIQADPSPRRAKDPQRAYHCVLCAGAHLTSAPYRIPAQSKKRQREQGQRSRMLAQMFGRSPLCAVPDCNQFADDAHEPLTRGRGGAITDPTNVVPLCRSHHDEITSRPTSELAWAYELNLLRHSWQKEATA